LDSAGIQTIWEQAIELACQDSNAILAHNILQEVAKKSLPDYTSHVENCYNVLLNKSLANKIKNTDVLKILEDAALRKIRVQN